MEQVLIIKTGAAGDVVRTTCLLNGLKGNIYWVTSPAAIPLLQEDEFLTLISVQNAFKELESINFDRVISLEEDPACAQLATEKGSRELAGVYFNDGKVVYTDNSAHWFDMSRISRFGLKKANELKAANALTYQESIFKMIGKQFIGEPCRIYRNTDIKQENHLVGIEKRSGNVWPNKQWWGYDELEEKLNDSGVNVFQFGQRENIRDYLDDIARCSHIVSGDTLAMHVAMAYGISCTAIFNCTSPQEIYDYGLLRKLVSPFYLKYFYATTHDPEVIASVALEDVYKSIPRI